MMITIIAPNNNTLQVKAACVSTFILIFLSLFG